MAELWEQLITSLGSALVGGFIAGYFTLKATSRAIQREKEKLTEQERQTELGLLQALHDEIDILWGRYNSGDGLGVRLEALQENQPLLVYYPVAEDYFAVYRGNTFLISRIRNNNLRRLIVAVYTRAMSMIDSVRMNNELVGKHEYWSRIFQHSGQENDRQNAIQFFQSCVAYAKAMKITHTELKKDVTALLRQLNEQGVINERQN